MTIKDIETAVKEIAAIAGDFEVAHGREDKLWEAVLQAIADGTAENPAAMARMALTTRLQQGVCMTTKATVTDVAIGQLWQDKDKRVGTRIRKVVEIDGIFAVLAIPNHPRFNTRVRLRTLRRRWKLVTP